MNGYRGLHEFASGTRVLELATRRRRGRRFDGSTFSLQVVRPQGMPEKVGRFLIDGAVRWRHLPEHAGDLPDLGAALVALGERDA